jgi:hypothetical protein
MLIIADVETSVLSLASWFLLALHAMTARSLRDAVLAVE